MIQLHELKSKSKITGKEKGGKDGGRGDGGGRRSEEGREPD